MRAGGIRAGLRETRRVGKNAILGAGAILGLLIIAGTQAHHSMTGAGHSLPHLAAGVTLILLSASLGAVLNIKRTSRSRRP